MVYGYHRMLSKRFPYAVYHRVESDFAVVWPVLDLRRHPDKIRHLGRYPQAAQYLAADQLGQSHCAAKKWLLTAYFNMVDYLLRQAEVVCHFFLEFC